MRALIIAVIVLVSSAADAQWHAAATPPRPTLPAVAVDFGYPGPYVPWDSAPITLHATAGDAPFDGYIGFHFRVNEHFSYDTPVVARAVLRPHEQWTFSTFARLRRQGVISGNYNSTDPTPRALFVEWRDAAQLEAAAQNAGTPPWTLWNAEKRALRVTHAGESAPASVLGRAACTVNANQLSDRAQWYAGFDGAAVPLDVWLDLPRRVREAMVGSRVELALFGLPRGDQQLDDLDRALLPVTFAGGTAKAKADTDAIGSDMVRSAAATWCASGTGVSAALPATRSTTARTPAGYEISFLQYRSGAWPRPAQLLRRYAGLVTSLAAAVIAVAGWILLRRRQRAGIAVAMLGFAVIVLGVRPYIRQSTGRYVFSVQAPIVDGIADTLEVDRTWGASPLAVSADAAPTRTGVTGADDLYQRLEVRTSETPLAMGAFTRFDWNAITRWTRRRELTAAGARVRVHSSDAKKLVIDFESPFNVNRVWAQWLCGDHLCVGETDMRRAASGTVTIESHHLLWNEVEPFLVENPAPRIQKSFHQTDVVLMDRSASGNRQIEWFGPRAEERPVAFSIVSQPSLEADGSTSWSFALPAGSHAGADILLPMNAAIPELTLTSASGTVTLHRYAQGIYPIPGNLLGGGVAMKISTKKPTVADAVIKVRETKP
ncbi:MAG TPA: hypothetical protein VJZ76_06500 [Thermoanaerobaculia bacterium]|nr:hypothetical protein [Thermoanaerobaculia bacterium]